MVVWLDVLSSSHVDKVLETAHWAELVVRLGLERYAMKTLSVLYGLLEHHGDDHSVLSLVDLVPSQLPDLACRSRVRRHEIRRAKHRKIKEDASGLKNFENS